MNTFHPLANPEAGNHPLPDDPREIEAALRAGQYSWDVCPYYAFRYAERGRLFTRSDSGYLVIMTHEDSFHVQEQITWLARVLSSRGMPTWLLEQHLYRLYGELCSFVPQQQPRYEKLRQAADDLQQRRLARINSNRWQRLGNHFHQLVAGDSWFEKLRDPGGLLIAAVVDEANDFTEALPSLLSWLADPQRFSTQWIEAIEQTLVHARTSVAP